MASYFPGWSLRDYFNTSSMSKRLLQYGLSRMEIFDTDALGLDKLDITLGRVNTFEFRDVGLRLGKLESLLQLPPAFELVKARVILLRLTIPVDFYKSPITVEVDGVEGQLRVKPETSTPRTNHDRKGKRPRSRSFGNKHRHRRGSAYEDDDDLAPAIPTAANLAESFLQTAPEDEKADMEAAILSETQELGTAASATSDDDEFSEGTGNPLSLPGFLTNIFQGIADRVQIRIRGITFNLDLEIPSETSRSLPPSATDPVTVQLRIEKVDVEGVTTILEETVLGEGKPGVLYKEGKRLISLTDIRGALISEANLFSSLARSSAPSSPSVGHSEVSENRRSTFKSTSSRESTTRAFDDTTSEHGSASNISPSRFSTASSSRNASDVRSLGGSAVASESGRFDDASEDGEGSHMSESMHKSLSNMGDSIFQNSAYLDQLAESQYSDEEDGREKASHPSSYFRGLQMDGRVTSPLSTPRASMILPLGLEREAEALNSHAGTITQAPSMLQSTVLPPRPRSRFSEGRISQSQPSLPAAVPSNLDRSEEIPKESITNFSGDAAKNSESDEEDGASTPVNEQDLTQSQLFSHEEAESMYMSAVSHASSTRVPGGWDNSDGSDEDASSPSSPVLPKAEEEPRYNLEHALQNSPMHTTGDLQSLEQSSSSVSESLRMSKASQSTSPTSTRAQPSPPTPQISSSESERSTTSSDEYSRLSKQIFSLDRVDMYLPSSRNSEVVVDPEVTARNAFGNQSEIYQSTSINLPGAFSTHLPKKKAQFEPPSLAAETPSTAAKSTANDDTAIEVELGQLSTQFDISVGRLIFKLVQQLSEALKSEPAPTTSSNSTPSTLDLKLSVVKASLVFVERIEGILGSTHAATDAGQSAVPQDSEVLLRATLGGLDINTQASNATTTTTLTLKKFVFGYAQESIISFDAGLQMGASVRDLQAADGIDVRVNISTTDVTRCEATTLPMHVSIDLQRLDETFSWFGGLSSVLNLGSSVASNTTITAGSPNKPKPRGVRFETPIKTEDKSLAAQSKTNLRIGGVILDLIGAECSIAVETSAIKIANRAAGTGVSVQAIRLSGPHLRHSNETPAIIANIGSTRIDYLPAPASEDIDRLLNLITPSKSKFDEADDFLLDTLIRQRRNGPVLRLDVEDFQLHMTKLDELSYLPNLGEEVSRLATVAKYLPDDERPGLLSLIKVRNFDADVDVDKTVGTVQLSSGDLEIAQISLPFLVAARVDAISLRRNISEEIIGAATDPNLRQPSARAPAIMVRMIGGEMEPVVKIKLWNVRIEYRVPTLLTVLGLLDTPEDMSASLENSVATLIDFARAKGPGADPRPITSPPHSKPLAIDVVMRDCVLGLNPQKLPSKLLVVLTEAHVNAVLPSEDQNASASMELAKASLVLIDNTANLSSDNLTVTSCGGNSQLEDLCSMGYASVGYISSAKAVVKIKVGDDEERSIDVDVRDDLFVLETCADSTKTLIATLSGLAPPSIPSKESKYRTEVTPIEDLLASLDQGAFGRAEGNYNIEDDFSYELDLEDETDINSHFFGDEDYDEAKSDAEGSLSSANLSTRDTHDGVLLESSIDLDSEEDVGDLDIQENYFGTASVLEGTAHRWDSTKGTYDNSNVSKVQKSPLKAYIRDMHIIWNLFDGYDWQYTRDAITKKVEKIESDALEKRARNDRRPTFDQDVDDEEETVIGDFLFNSIYIGVPGNRDPRELAAAINRELNDDATETESIATTYMSSAPSRQGSVRKPKPKKLRLGRSKKHKITFELGGVSADFVAFPSGAGETLSSVDIRVHNLEVFDHVATSAWNKFATYLRASGERESGASMVHLEILSVKPVSGLSATELVVNARVLPLHLHVDQDTLNFITRFFSFKDDAEDAPTTPIHTSHSEEPFIQRIEVGAIPVKLCFKPKRVDYAGLRSGRTSELMNFVVLEDADILLRRTILYGVLGFEKVGDTLDKQWTNDVIKTQLPRVLSGLAPVRSLANMGGGFSHLITVPINEYKKDGRVVRAFSKGASAFAKTTGTELVKLGAKLAIGAQGALQNAEGYLGPSKAPLSGGTDSDDEETKRISPYANQPTGVIQGLRGGYASLRRDLLLAGDAIIAVPSEVMESGDAAGVLRAVRKHGPTVILRPVIGATKAGAQFFMGATNSLDPGNLQRVDAKYKKH
ncbi:Autophagy-related protein [Lachnellula suecica]|uniref:Autophagy-related protein 2 n=1 Tax=Lachnellula suecica TaxID=602035 RepID=A0A8T9CJ59_9HELO|nr:Autophagy-related protein [Lachnellula suecica]